MAITGGCYCGKIRYAIEQETLHDVANCHCSICRRTTGGTLTTWATIPQASLRWETVAPHVYQSSAEAERYFCSTCGAQLALYTILAPLSIDITIATLDHPDAYPPDRHIWVNSKLSWFRLDGELAQEQEEIYQKK